METSERDRMLALLESTHAFPCAFFLSVITLNRDDVRLALRVALEARLEAPIPDEAWETRTSSAGRYASHRVTLPCRSAEHVLAIYACARAVDGVVTVL